MQIAKPKQNSVAGAASLLGMGAGAIVGAPTVGASVGGMIGGQVDQQRAMAPEPIDAGSGDAITRKLASMGKTPEGAIEEGVQALQDPNIPPEMKEQASRPILSAYEIMKRQQGA